MGRMTDREAMTSSASTRPEAQGHGVDGSNVVEAVVNELVA